MKVISYPKINLSLIVKKKRKNLHKIRSFFYLDNTIFDEMEIEKSKINTNNIKYIVDGKEIQLKDCILEKTIKYINNKFNINLSYSIKVKKNIPIGSGLGGASSNAAALINYIEKTENIKMKNIKKWIKDIGSDVYFFYKGIKFAFVYSYGDRLIKLNTPKINYEVILNKDINCSTKDVYNQFDKLPYKRRSVILQLIYIKLKCYNKLLNVLQEPCFTLYLDMRDKYNDISEKNIVILSGSGSSFILFKGEKNE